MFKNSIQKFMASISLAGILCVTSPAPAAAYTLQDFTQTLSSIFINLQATANYVISCLPFLAKTVQELDVLDQGAQRVAQLVPGFKPIAEEIDRVDQIANRLENAVESLHLQGIRSSSMATNSSNNASSFEHLQGISSSSMAVNSSNNASSFEIPAGL